ncbi:DNA-3-methyladenine glycosylase 2 family protein [Streptomyces sp. ISL-99]|uniref:DNA-3-methyladenine glycosylase family protein n=1 Tax=Streptomyces sp. ISL-99 TaxID=2819193 RepID=UPI001BE85547|nr:DNA-3-methyladenine glycosylase 2 family protein [Streptomyces sp. ISL-99]MBT2525494.1 DNA-3-methyladenine glycosylase 2 family protein [Streptomyces sp. ISL-99]
MSGRFAPRPVTRTPVRDGDTTVPPQTPPRTPPSTTITGHTRTRTWTPPWPLDLGLVLGPLRRGPADPTFRTTPDGAFWRTSRTPAGPGTLRVAARGGAVEATAWGEGAEQLLDQLPPLLGSLDDPSAFEPRHRVVAETWRRRPGLRLGRTGLVLESLIPSILEQKVTTDEAYRAWRLLLRKYGEPAPGPVDGRMHVMPCPRTWSLIPSWEWHRAGVDSKRSATILRAVRVAKRLEAASTMPLEEASARLQLIPGIGPWTAAETLQRSNGAPDAVSVGDYHLPSMVGYALAGDRDADDEAMLELLAPYAGQRHRAARLILLSGTTPPRRAPRMTPRNIATL